MKCIFFYIVGLLVFSTLLCEGAGIVAWKQHAFHEDSLAHVSTYSRKRFNGNEGIFHINGKDVYLPGGRHWYIDIPNGLPSELSDSVQYEMILKQKYEMGVFRKRFPKSSNILDPWLKKLQEYQQKYDSGQYLVDGVWMEKAVYEQQQAELREKRKQRRLKEEQKRGEADDHTVEAGSDSVERKETSRISYADGSLKEIRGGSFEGAKIVVKRLEQNKKSMDSAGQNQAQQLILSIKRLFTAQSAYKNALKQQAGAKAKAEQYERQAEDNMRPSPLTGEPNSYMANNARKKARQVILNAEHALSNGKKELLQALKQSDTLASSLYKDIPQDAENLALAVMAIAESHNGEIHFRSRFEGTKGKEDRRKGEIAREQEGEQLREEKEREEQNLREKQKQQIVREKEEERKEEELKMKQSSPDERLLYGIEKNQEAWVRQALEDGANVDGLPNTANPLHKAVRAHSDFHSMTIIKLLVEKGARMDLRIGGDTPFFAADNSEVKNFFISKGYIPDPVEIEARENRQYEFGTVIQILRNGVLLERKHNQESPIVFAQFDALLPTHQINQQEDEKNAIAEGDICHYHYASVSRFQYTSINGAQRTIPSHDVLKKTMYIDYYIGDDFRGKVIQILEYGMLVLMEFREFEFISDMIGSRLVTKQRIIYVEKHPNQNRLCDNDDLHFKGKRTGVFIYKDVKGNERIVPKVECINNFLK